MREEISRPGECPTLSWGPRLAGRDAVDLKVAGPPSSGLRPGTPECAAPPVERWVGAWLPLGSSRRGSPEPGAWLVALKAGAHRPGVGGDGAKPGRGREEERPRLPDPGLPTPRRSVPPLGLPSSPRPAPPPRAHRPLTYLNSPVHWAKSAVETPNIPHIDPVTA